LRASDFVGRYGGEEFVALLPDTDRDGGVEAAEKLRLAMTQVRAAGVGRGVTASFGVATLPEDAPDGPGLLRQADRALYRAKELGRNRVETATQSATRA
jgi:diguanylate cyclase (GGDEF)-like protein